VQTAALAPSLIGKCREWELQLQTSLHGPQKLAKVEIIIFEVVEECGPLGVGAGKCGASRRFAITGEDTTDREGDFDAVTFNSTAAGFAPLGMRQVHALVYLSYSVAIEARNCSEWVKSSAVS
jgi:hypothetical protein